MPLYANWSRGQIQTLSIPGSNPGKGTSFKEFFQQYPVDKIGSTPIMLLICKRVGRIKRILF